jgi:GTP-binding protein
LEFLSAEAFSVARSLKAISRADVVVQVIDVTEEISEQDQRIANRIEDAGRACVVVMNKWDLQEDKTSGAMNEIKDHFSQELRHIGYAEVLFTSALTKVRVRKILEAAKRAYEETQKRVSTSILNQIVNESVALVPPPSGKRGKRLKIYYATQVSTAPPTFVLFVNDEHLLPKNYKTYLERKLRESFGFKGTPIRITARSKGKQARAFKS